jgi:hypothetical protein
MADGLVNFYTVRGHRPLIGRVDVPGSRVATKEDDEEA